MQYRGTEPELTKVQGTPLSTFVGSGQPFSGQPPVGFFEGNDRLYISNGMTVIPATYGSGPPSFETGNSYTFSNPLTGPGGYSVNPSGTHAAVLVDNGSSGNIDIEIVSISDPANITQETVNSPGIPEISGIEWLNDDTLIYADPPNGQHVLLDASDKTSLTQTGTVPGPTDPGDDSIPYLPFDSENAVVFTVNTGAPTDEIFAIDYSDTAAPSLGIQGYPTVLAATSDIQYDADTDAFYIIGDYTPPIGGEPALDGGELMTDGGGLISTYKAITKYSRTDSSNWAGSGGGSMPAPTDGGNPAATPFIETKTVGLSVPALPVPGASIHITDNYVFYPNGGIGVNQKDPFFGGTGDFSIYGQGGAPQSIATDGDYVYSLELGFEGGILGTWTLD